MNLCLSIFNANCAFAVTVKRFGDVDFLFWQPLLWGKEGQARYECPHNLHLPLKGFLGDDPVVDI